MKPNDNTVNIVSTAPADKDRYHHGDLRAALVAEGLKELDSGSVDALSLRGVARKVGVSATAVYRHFPDKAAFIQALCHEGHARIAEAFRQAMAGAPSEREAFVAMGRAYVRYALANPALFRLTMTHASGEGECEGKGPVLDAENDGRVLLAASLERLTAGKAPDDQRRRQLKAWSLVHGLAMLMLDGQVPPDDALIDGVIDPEGLLD